MTQAAAEDTLTPAEALQEMLRTVWNTLMFYANETSYYGERTGGVLEGCPRGPAPRPDQLVFWARSALADIRRFQGMEVDDWLLAGKYPPAGPLPVMQSRLLVARGLVEQLLPRLSYFSQHDVTAQGAQEVLQQAQELLKTIREAETAALAGAGAEVDIELERQQFEAAMPSAAAYRARHPDNQEEYFAPYGMAWRAWRLARGIVRPQEATA